MLKMGTLPEPKKIIVNERELLSKLKQAEKEEKLECQKRLLPGAYYSDFMCMCVCMRVYVFIDEVLIVLVYIILSQHVLL